MKKIINAMITAFFSVLLAVSASAEVENIIYTNSFSYGLEGISNIQKTDTGGGYEIRTEDTKKILSVSLGMAKDGTVRSVGAAMGDENMKNYTLRVRMRCLQTIKADGLIFFNASSGAEYYALRVYSDGTIKLFKNSLTTDVGGSGAGILPHVSVYMWNTYTVKSVNGFIEVYVNNIEEPVISWVDSSPIESGRVGVGIIGSTYAPAQMHFSDLEVIGETLEASNNAAAVLASNTALAIGSPRIFINGEKRYIDNLNPDIVPYLDGGRTMVPLRAYGEAIGFEADYSEGQIVLRSGDKILSVTAGSNLCSINGEEYRLTNNVTVKNDRSFVPLRDIAQLFGKEVLWRDNGVIIISGNSIESMVDYETADIISKNLGKNK